MKEEGHRKHEKCAIKVRFTAKATANDERKIKQRFRRNDPFDLACVSHFAEMHAAHSHIDAMRERYYDEQWVGVSVTFEHKEKESGSERERATDVSTTNACPSSGVRCVALNCDWCICVKCIYCLLFTAIVRCLVRCSRGNALSTMVGKLKIKLRKINETFLNSKKARSENFC